MWSYKVKYKRYAKSILVQDTSSIILTSMLLAYDTDLSSRGRVVSSSAL